MCKKARSVEEVTVDLLKLTESLFYMIEDRSFFTKYDTKELSSIDMVNKSSITKAEEEFAKLKQELTGDKNG